MARRKKRDVPRRKIPSPSPRYRDDYRHIIRDKPHVDSVSVSSSKRFDLRPVEDLRHVPDNIDYSFKTLGGRPARQVSRIQGTVHESGVSAPVHSYFQDPRRVLVCIRRDNRRRVLFALRKIGKGRKVSPFHRFTEKSLVRCK